MCAAGLLGVAVAEHLGEGHHLFLAAAFFAGFFVVALGADVLDDVLAFEFLFETAEGAVNGLAFADFDFDGHIGKGGLFEIEGAE